MLRINALARIGRSECAVTAEGYGVDALFEVWPRLALAGTSTVTGLPGRS
jgi:hypothetical protein